MKWWLLAAALASGALSSTACLADDWYAGLAGGAGFQKKQDIPLAFNGGGKYSDDESSVVKVIVGRALSPHFAIELAYSDFGKQNFGGSGFLNCCHPGPNPLTNYAIERRVSGFVLDLAGNLALTPAWAMIGAIGFADMRVRSHQYVEFGATPFGPATHFAVDVSGWHTAAHASLGLAWSPYPAWTLRLMGEYVSPVGEPRAFIENGAMTTGRSAIGVVSLAVLRAF